MDKWDILTIRICKNTFFGSGRSVNLLRRAYATRCGLEYEYVKACGDEYLFKYLIELVGRYSTVNFQRLIDEASDKKVEMYGGKSSDSYYTRFATVTASLIRRIPGNKLPKEYIPHAAFRRMFPRA